MNAEDTVKILVGDVEVTGIITNRTNRRIRVEIVHPLCSIATGATMPLLPIGNFNAFAGARGDEIARGLLARCYEIGSYLTANIDLLKERLVSTREEIEQLSTTMLSNDHFSEPARILKQRLKRGEISNKEYQKELRPLRRLRNESRGGDFRIMASFFKNNFPMGVSYEMEDSVLDILEGRKFLT